MTEEPLTLNAFQELHNKFNHECSKIINAIEMHKSTIKALTDENEKLKKYKDEQPDKKAKLLAEFRAKVTQNLVEGKPMFEGL